MDTDESIGPVPGVSDFHPTKPQSPLLSPNPAPCLPDNPVMPAKPIRILTAPMSLQDIFVFATHIHQNYHCLDHGRNGTLCECSAISHLTLKTWHGQASKRVRRAPIALGKSAICTQPSHARPQFESTRSRDHIETMRTARTHCYPANQ